MMLWVSLPVKDNLLLVYCSGVVAPTLLEYVTGTITVVTPDAIKTSSMHDMALQLAGRQMNYPEPPLGSLQLEKIPSNTRDFSHK